MSTLNTAHEGETSAVRPNADTLRTISIVLIVIGVFISGYLSYIKLTPYIQGSEAPMICVTGGVFNCEVVQSSAYSRLFGIPIAWLGFAVYLILGAIIFLEKRVGFFQENGVLLFFGLNLFAWMFSMWLVYVQFVLLQALCPWCLSHELNITILFIVSCLRLRKTLMA